MMTVVSSRHVEAIYLRFPVSIDFLESLHRLLANLVNPLSRSPSQFGMVFRLPGSRSSTQCLPLTIELNFALRQFHQESGALPVADDLIDFRDHIGGIRNHHSLARHNNIAPRRFTMTQTTVVNQGG